VRTVFRGLPDRKVVTAATRRGNLHGSIAAHATCPVMQIRVGYELCYECAQPTSMLLMLNIHYTRASDSSRRSAEDHALGAGRHVPRFFSATGARASSLPLVPHASFPTRW